MTPHREGLGNKPIIVIIGLIASCIAIFSFLTGWQSIFEIFRRSSPTSLPTVIVQPEHISTEVNVLPTTTEQVDE